MKIKVMLVEDYAHYRRRLRALLEREPDMTVVAETDDGRRAVGLARETAPHVAVLDVAMPVLDGMAAARLLRSEAPGLKIIGLSGYPRELVAGGMLAAGAEAFIQKEHAHEELVPVIRRLIPAEIRANEEDGRAG
jgi:DNA-binding NarL/FixJ family response regulator